MHNTGTSEKGYAPRVPDAVMGVASVDRVWASAAVGRSQASPATGTSGAGRRTLLCLRELLVLALMVCTGLPLQAQHGGGHAGGGGGFSGGHAGGGGGLGGGGVRGGGFSGGAPGRSFGGSAYRGYPAAGRPSFASAQRFGGGYGAPGGLRSPGYAGLRGAARGPVRTAGGRPAFYNRAGVGYGAGRYGYGYGRGYGYRNPYFGFGYRYPYPLFGFGFSPFFYPGLLGYDFLNWDWDALGWDDPAWNPNVSYNDGGYGAGAGYDTGPGYNGGAGYSGNPGYGQAPAQPYNGQPADGYGPQAPPAPSTGESRPAPLLPQYESQPYGAAPAREDLTTIIFKDGRPPVQIRNYAMTRTALLVSGPGNREIPLNEVDLPATERVNGQAGINFRLP